MNATDFFDSKTIKHQLKQQLKDDYEYCKDAIVLIMEQYARLKIEEKKEQSLNTQCLLFIKKYYRYLNLDDQKIAEKLIEKIEKNSIENKINEVRCFDLKEKCSNYKNGYCKMVDANCVFQYIKKT